MKVKHPFNFLKNKKTKEKHLEKHFEQLFKQIKHPNFPHPPIYFPSIFKIFSLTSPFLRNIYKLN